MSRYELRNELDDLRADYLAAEKMSEIEIQNKYNTDDSKAEFLSRLQEDIDILQFHYDEAEVEEVGQDRDWRTRGLDIAFSSWAEVNRMFV